jgi:RNA polymerase sigma-70 factor, ECF subfamily
LCWLGVKDRRKLRGDLAERATLTDAKRDLGAAHEHRSRMFRLPVIPGTVAAIVGYMDDRQLQAVTSLYERYAEAVHRYALRRSDRETAEEVTAQVFMVAWRRRSALPEDALPWLYGVARRVLAEHRRGVARRRRLAERLRGEPIEAPPTPELLDEGLAGALRQLSPSDRETLLLRYWEDLKPAQIAKVMGCSRATMAVRLHRARLRLRRELEAEGDRPNEDQEHEESCVTRTEPA